VLGVRVHHEVRLSRCRLDPRQNPVEKLVSSTGSPQALFVVAVALSAFS